MTDAPHIDHPDIGATLGKKLGPLPMGVWIAAIGGGLVLAYVMRSRSSGASGDAGTTSSGAEAGADDWDYGTSNGVGQTGYPGSTTTTDTGTSAITTNEQWQRRAVSVLVGLGYEGTVVDRAIGNYLGGNPLTTVERAIVNEAIIRLGPPPISPPPPPTADQPPPVVTPPPMTSTPTVPVTPPVIPPAPSPTVHKYPERRTYHTNKQGDNYSSLAAKYGTGLSGTELYAYQFTAQAGRSATAVASLRKYGPNRIYPTGATAIPYPK